MWEGTLHVLLSDPNSQEFNDIFKTFFLFVFLSSNLSIPSPAPTPTSFGENYVGMTFCFRQESQLLSLKYVTNSKTCGFVYLIISAGRNVVDLKNKILVWLVNLF